MPTEISLGNLKIHKVPNYTTWENNYNQTDGIGVNDIVIIPPAELKKGILPAQTTSDSGKFLTTNGSVASWATVDALPPQSGNSGKFLTTNSNVASWASISIPSAATSVPLMDSGNIGTIGISSKYALEDHIHPVDTSRQAKITASGILKGNGSGTISEATAGTDYIAPPSSPNNGNVLTYNGTSWVASAPATGLPDMENNSGKYLTTNGSVASWVSVSFVPTSRTINSKALSSDITLNASDVGALSSSTLGAANGVAELDSHGKIKATQASARLVTLSQFTTLQDIHDGCILYNPATSTRSLTVKSLYEGFECEVMKYNTGNITISADEDESVYLNGVLGGSKQITEQYKSAVLKAIDATHWVIQGAIE